MGKHRIPNVEELWLFPVPELAEKVPGLGFTAYWSCPSLLPVPARVSEAPVPSAHLQQMGSGHALSWLGPF